MTQDGGGVPVAYTSRRGLTAMLGTNPDTIRVFYLAADNHVHGLDWNSYQGKWSHYDVTTDSGGELAVIGSTLTSMVDSNVKTHVYYQAVPNGHVYELLQTVSEG